MKNRRLIVGISGSSGVILGVRLLEALRSTDVESHLVITPSARLTLSQETDRTYEQVTALADVVYTPKDIAAAIASGSFDALGMVIIPCSIKTLSAVANSYAADLLSRAADVTLKEGRPLLLVVREAPLHVGHTRLLHQAAESGAIIFPPVPAFYTQPTSLNDVVDNIVGRVLKRIGIDNDLYGIWTGPQAHRTPEPLDELFNLPALTLATSGADGAPHAAPVYFAASAEKTLYFYSETRSQHSQDLAQNPQAAAAVYPIVGDWQAIRGLQMRGWVKPLTPGPEWETAWQIYLAKFPFVAEMKEIVAKNQFYAFTPTWFRLTDNRRGFGYKEEWTPA